SASELRRAYRSGRRPKPIAWEARARELWRQAGGPVTTQAQAWDLVAAAATGDDEVFHEAVLTNEDRSSCSEIQGDRVCAKGQHVHWVAPGGRLRSVSR